MREEEESRRRAIPSLKPRAPSCMGVGEGLNLDRSPAWMQGGRAQGRESHRREHLIEIMRKTSMLEKNGGEKESMEEHSVGSKHGVRSEWRERHSGCGRSVSEEEEEE